MNLFIGFPFSENISILVPVPQLRFYYSTPWQLIVPCWKKWGARLQMPLEFLVMESLHPSCTNFSIFQKFSNKHCSQKIITNDLDVCLFLRRKTSPNMTVDNQQAPLLLRIPNRQGSGVGIQRSPVEAPFFTFKRTGAGQGGGTGKKSGGIKTPFPSRGQGQVGV